MLRSHHLRVLLDITYSTSMKSWYYPDTVYLHRWWALWVGWCLDSLCGGSIMGSLICHYPSVVGVNINRGLSPRLTCVWTWCIDCLCTVLSSVLQGPSRVSGCFLLCNLLLLLGCVRLVSYYESHWWPMYEWCTDVCYSVDFMFVFCLVLISYTITSTYTVHYLLQGRINLFGAPRQWKHFRPLFQAVFLSGGITPQTESNTMPPSPKTEITNILFYILNFASIIKFKM